METLTAEALYNKLKSLIRISFTLNKVKPL